MEADECSCGQCLEVERDIDVVGKPKISRTVKARVVGRDDTSIWDDFARFCDENGIDE